jgi:Gamma-glutamyl cyclotransferase, AIG2-like
LQQRDVQLATFRRRLAGQPDRLIGYKLQTITIDDENFVAKSGTAQHRNLQFTGDASDYVEGTVLSLTKKELEDADAYEPHGYKRVLVQTNSGLSAWVYLNSRQDLQDFS